jgi:hypothetical protein
MSVAFTAGVFVTGLLSTELRRFGDIVDVSPGIARLVSTVGWVVPAFSAFDIKSQVVHGLVVSSGFVLYTLAYGALYIVAAVIAAITAFSRREFV